MRIVPFKPRHAQGFFDLNRAWLEAHGMWQEAHADELGDPAAIIAGGGRIYVAERRGSVAGTCAVVSGRDGGMEIRWLAVEPEWQRLGIGRRLLTRCAGYARRQGARRVMAVSSGRLVNAIRLYRDFGFADVTPPRDITHAGADVFMELEFRPAALVYSTISARS